MIFIRFQGYEISATGHNLTQEQLELLKSQELNHSNVDSVIQGYDPWSTNYFQISGPVVDESLMIQIYDSQERSIWSGTCEALLDVYEHADKYPEILELESWDEPKQSGDAVAYGAHPRILYYEELNKGDVVGQCRVDASSFDPLDLSVVQGCIETPECDWYYVNKVYYKGRLLSLEPLSHDLKNVRTLFQVIE